MKGVEQKPLIIQNRGRNSNRLLISLTLLLMIVLLGQPVGATGTMNEFKIQAVHQDQLAKYNRRNCTALLDSKVAVTYCEDGYMALDMAADLVNPYSTINNKANRTLD